MVRDPKENILQIQLSKWHSLDLVRLPKSRKYRIVFAERFGVQRRAFVEILFEEARAIALFLANSEEGMSSPGENFDPPTDSGTLPGLPFFEAFEARDLMSRTTTQSPPDPTAELQAMMKAYVEHEIDPIPRPIPPEQDARTGSGAVTLIHAKGKPDLDR
jgi:hypothetical protein